MSVLATTFDAAKKHPYWLVGGVLIVIVVFQLKGDKTTTSPAGNTGITTLEEDPNQIAANTALQESANELNAETIEANDAVQMNAANDAVQTASINTEGTLYQNYFNTMASVQNNQTAAAQQVTDQQTSAEQSVSQLNLETNAVVATQGAALAAGLQNEQDQYSNNSNLIGAAEEQAAGYTGTQWETSTFGAVLNGLEGQPDGGQFADLSSTGAGAAENANVAAYSNNTSAMLANIFNQGS